MELETPPASETENAESRGEPSPRSPSLWSIEFRQSPHFTPVLIAGVAFLVMVLVGFRNLNEWMNRNSWDEGSGLAGWVSAGLFLGALIAFLYVLVQVATFRDSERLRSQGKATKDFATRLRESIGPSVSDDFVDVWLDTYDRLRAYHDEAQRQARTAYFITQAAAIIGLTAVGALGVLAATSDEGTAAAAAAAVAVAGAALSGFIIKTFQDSYRTAVSQRMAYFGEPTAMVRLMAAERLLQYLPEEAQVERSRAVETMIQAVLGMESPT